MQRMLERPMLESWWFRATEQSGHRWREEWRGEPLYTDAEAQDPLPGNQLAFVKAVLELQIRRGTSKQMNFLKDIESMPEGEMKDTMVERMRTEAKREADAIANRHLQLETKTVKHEMELKNENETRQLEEKMRQIQSDLRSGHSPSAPGPSKPANARDFLLNRLHGEQAVVKGSLWSTHQSFVPVVGSTDLIAAQKKANAAAEVCWVRQEAIASLPVGEERERQIAACQAEQAAVTALQTEAQAALECR